MNKTRIVLWGMFVFLSILVAATVFISTGKVCGATITVDDSGGRDYATIWAGINAASAGDTVYVYNGTYNEAVTISKRINLVGESNQSTIIKGTNASDSRGIYPTANYVNISNLKIDKFYYGIRSSSSNSNITGNTVANCSYGIYLYTSSNNNNISSNTVTNSSYYGINLYSSSNNNITSNTLANCSRGIYLSSSSNNNNISSNTVTNSSYYGIYLEYGSKNNITSNTLANCSSGIYLSTISNNSISSNAISNCGDYGIYLMYGTNNNLTSNTLANSSNYGIYIGSNSNYNNITSNTLANSSKGIYLGYGSNNNITSNTVSNHSSYGIYLEYCSNNNITSNTVSNCSSGIYLYYSSNNNIITSNNIYGNKQWGLYRYSGTDNTALNNWWGDASGPYNAASNPSGTGDNITDGTPFTPWAIWPFPANLPETPSITTLQYTDTDGNYNINWTASNYVTNYIIYENGVQIFNGTNTSRTYAFTNKPDGNYTHTVKAWNINGTSANSTPVAIIVDIAKIPSAPSITTTAYTDTDGNYTINWTASNYAPSYILYENNVEIYNGTLLTKAFTNKSNTNYIYKVNAWNINGSSSYSLEVTIIVSVPTAPNLPYTQTITTVPYTDTDGNYTINWTASNYVERYILYENGTQVYNGTELSYSLSNKSSGTYAYKVKAWNANGTSANSTEVTITVSISAVATNLPSVPSITTNAYTDTDGAYLINWTASDYATNYILYENGIEIYNGTALTRAFTKPNGTYTYKIQAWNTNGTSTNSSEVIITVNIPVIQSNPPSIPTITTTPCTDTDGNYSINWTSSAYAASYLLYENDIDIYNGTSLSHAFSNKPNSNYVYKIKAWNINGTSEYSSAVTVIVSVAGAPNLPYTPVTITTPYTDTDGTYVVNWSSSNYAERYNLYENDILVYNGTNITMAFTGKVNGTYTYKVRAWNANGTSANSTPIIITVNFPAWPGAPSITTIPYTDTDGNYVINWTTADYVDKYVIEENGVEIYNGTNTTYAVTNKSDGNYVYKVKAWNINGTSTDIAQITISVNLAYTPPITNNPPTVAITSRFIEKVKGTISVTGTASDGVSIDKVQIKIDNFGWIDATGKTSWNHSLDTTTLSNGNHTITVRAYDGSLYSQEEFITISVENKPTASEPEKETSKGFLSGFETAAMFAALGVCALIVNGDRKRRR
ncbi:MAG: right-handed parallel beta-helix repeat-containing protein [Thermoplasmata archaeon]